MSVDKFRFVSPGVQVQEIDNSQLPRTGDAVGPVVIGRSLRGPIMRPVKVQSFSDFVEVFGEPHPGGVGGDVWRDGNKTAPTYGAYAAQAYLKNSSPLTFVRLAGYENINKTTGQGEAGWSTTNAYGLFVAPIVGSSETWSMPSTTASLAAVIYAGAGSYGLIGKQLTGSAIADNGLGVWTRATGTNLKFKIKVGGQEKTISFDKDSKNYIRTVLNTNPILTNSDITSPAEDYFLGETFKTWVQQVHGEAALATQNWAAVLVRLASADVNFANHKAGARDAETGWIVSQHLGATGSFSGSAEKNEYPVTKLFKFVGLTEGEWNSTNLKIAIEDIKESTNQFYKYGTFTVSVRKLSDNDLTPQYLERFTQVTLDPGSPNYIAKVIGDKYAEWNYDKKSFIDFGTYDNKSKFIRVETNPDADAGLLEPTLIPFGFYGPTVYKVASAATGALGSPVPAFSFINTALTGNNAFTASFALPEIPTLTSASISPAPSFGGVYFGFKTNVSSSKKHNEDMVDYVKELPAGAIAHAATYNSFLFSLDDISGSVTSGSIDKNQPVAWRQGFRREGLSLTARTSSEGNALTSSNGSPIVLSQFNRFVLPLLGGSDGVDITEKDPFNKRVLETNSGELTNYAYNSVKVAIETVADPEVVEMNAVALPAVENEGLTGLLIDKCEARGDSLAIIDLKGDYVPEEGKAGVEQTAADRKPDVDRVITNLKSRAINSSYGCAFFPWVLAKDNLNNNVVWLPPSIAALGTFSSSQKKTELWFAPAGFNRGGLTEGSAGIPVVQTALRLSSKDRDNLYSVNVNPIATFPSEGIVIFGQKTLQVTPSALDRINVRRLMIYLKKEISRMATTVLFDPNIQVTWKRFTNQAVPFLESVQSRFGLSEFRVVLDETTTTPELVDRNIVYAKILLKPTRAIEFIALDFVIANTGASFND